MCKQLGFKYSVYKIVIFGPKRAEMTGGVERGAE